jgi:hypothetical protein
LRWFAGVYFGGPGLILAPYANLPKELSCEPTI